MHRFFVCPDDIDLDTGRIIIRGEDAKHIGRVLRLQTGQEIEVGDGSKIDYRVIIDQVDKDRVYTHIVEAKASNKEAGLRITLYQGIPKSTKMDFIIQKCTELGIHTIVPIHMERSIVHIDHPKAQGKKIERWRRIAYEAAKQSKRGIIPKIERVKNLKEILSQIENHDMNIVAYENQKTKGIKELIKTQKTPIRDIGIIIGPEGGFEEEEIKTLEERGAFSISLGPRILRTETAGLVILAILMYELGDIGGF